MKNASHHELPISVTFGFKANEIAGRNGTIKGIGEKGGHPLCYDADCDGDYISMRLWDQERASPVPPCWLIGILVTVASARILIPQGGYPMTTHDANCLCVECRSRRAYQQTTTGPGAVPPELDPSILKERELAQQEKKLAAIKADPLAYIVEQKEGDVGDQAIGEQLAMAGVDADQVDGLYEQAQVILKSTQRRRGLHRILFGLGVGALGLVGAGVLYWLIGVDGKILILGGGGLLYGGFEVLRGVYMVVTAKPSAPEQPNY